jgi:hypothetical protein
LGTGIQILALQLNADAMPAQWMYASCAVHQRQALMQAVAIAFKA